MTFLMDDIKKQEKIAKVLECEICSQYLAHCMVEPLKCPGLSHNKDGELATSDGTLWKDIMLEHERKRSEEFVKFVKKNRIHLISHGIVE